MKTPEYYTLKQAPMLKAIQFTEENKQQVWNWVQELRDNVPHVAWDNNGKPALNVQSRENSFKVVVSNWLVLGMTGQLFSVSDEFFLNAYCKGHNYQKVKYKADKWDALGVEIESYYVRQDGSLIKPGDDDYSDDGLIGIGECAASAYSWL